MLKNTILSLSCLVAFGSASLPAAAAPSFYVVVPSHSRSAAAPAEDVVVTLSAGSLQEARVGQDYSQSLAGYLQVTGDPTYNPQNVAWSLAGGKLPEGLTLGAAGVVAGKPSAKDEAGSSFEVIASYKGKSGQQTYTIKVGDAVLEVTQIAAGASHTCAVTPVGAVKCWGTNEHGQLGDGSNSTSNIPVPVTGLTSGVTSIAAGGVHTCAVVGGAAKCWGTNGDGQLGDGTNNNSTLPVQVTGLTSGVSTITAGIDHSCAVVSGSAKCWGDNSFTGQLGDGSNTSSNIPVQVTELTSGVTSIAAGNERTCAVVSGAAKCWGNSSTGDGSTLSAKVPVQVIGLTAGVTSIAMGSSHTCAVVSGAAKCWGSNGQGQLGDGTTTRSSVPVQVIGLTSGVSTITAGYDHSCAVVSGAAKCWGWNLIGQLGDGTTTNSSVPVQVSGLTSGVRSIVAGSPHTCASVSGVAKCWGWNGEGQLGDGAAATNRTTPVSVKAGK